MNIYKCDAYISPQQICDGMKNFFLLACHFIIYNHFLFEQQCVHFELR